VCGWVPSAGQVSLSVPVGWGDTTFHATLGYSSEEVEDGLPSPPRIVRGLTEYPSSIATREQARRDSAWWHRLVVAKSRKQEREKATEGAAAKAPYSGKGKGRAGSRSVGGSAAGPSEPAEGGAWWWGVTETKRAPSAGRKKARTEAIVEKAERVCAFCPKVNRTGGTLPSPLLGPFTFRQGTFFYVHHICAMWAPEVYHDPETDNLCNVVAAYHRSRGLTCSVCSTNGAMVGCYVSACRHVYHFCCLYGHVPPSKSHPENNGTCVRHDEYYAAFCPAHAARAKDEEYVRRMMNDAALSTFLSDRAAAVQAALENEPTQGMDCPNYEVTGLRRNETETIFFQEWGVSSVEVDTSWVTIAGHPHRRVVRSGEQVALRDRPRIVPRCALSVAIRAGAAGAARGGVAGRATSVANVGEAVATGGGAASAAAATGAADAAGQLAAEGGDRGEDEVTAAWRCPVFLVRNIRRVQGVGRGAFRRSLPAVPGSFLRTTVVRSVPTHRHSLPAGMGGVDSRAPVGRGVPAAAGGGRMGTAVGGGGPAAGGSSGVGSAGNEGESVRRIFNGWPLPSPADAEGESGDDVQQ